MGSVRFELGGDAKAWVSNAQAASADGVALDVMADVGQRVFAATQEVVHVITGELKASGSVETTAGSEAVETVVKYDAYYASFEHDRGGAHAFMDRGWEMTEGDWSRAVEHAAVAMFESW